MGISHVAVQFPLYEKAKSWSGKSISKVLLCTIAERQGMQITTQRATIPP